VLNGNRYESAVYAVKDALQKLDEGGFPHQRPDDYFAEMVKSDDHMRKIKAELLEEKTRIEDAQERRRVREQKKFGKKIHRQKKKEKMDKKKKNKDEATEWKKRQKSGGSRGSSEPCVHPHIFMHIHSYSCTFHDNTNHFQNSLSFVNGYL
jgi:rRNA-processing protein EBP2